MRKLLVIMGAVFMMLSFSVLGFAQDRNMAGTTGTNYQTEKTTEHWLSSYTGEVVSVDRNTGSIVVKGNDGDRTFKVPGDMIKGVPETHQIVTVEYMSTDGKRVVTSVNPVPQTVANQMKWLYEKYVA